MLSIRTESNGLKAHASPTPETLKAGAITREQVMKTLEEEDVVFGIDDKAVAAIIDGIEKGDQKLFRVVIARGEAPTAGEPPVPAFLVKANAFVSKGAILVALKGGKLPKAGQAVCGTELPAPRAPSAPVTAGEHVDYVEDDHTIRTRVPGYAVIEGKCIGVEPLIQVSDDGMTASLQCRSMGEDTRLPSPADFTAMLRDAGVVEGIDQGALKHALNMMDSHREDDEPILVVVARGTEMQRGDDASFTFHVKGGRQAGELLPDGRMDYHWQLITSIVEADHLIAEKTPFTMGQPGRTVRGEELPSEPGQDVNLQPGENITVSSDGLQYTAGCDGVVLHEGDSIRVVDLFAVKGDVNYTTGNLNFDRSGVYVEGSVRSTFSVQASGSIVVRQSVEDAIIRSGEDIDVAKGILQRRLGSVRAEGRVTAAFVHDARIIAGDEIVIRDSAFRSFLAAKNRIILVDGKGVFVGGHAVASESIEVRIAGSDAYARTVLQVGLDYEMMKTLEDRLDAVETELAGLLHALDQGIDHKAGSRMAPPKDQHRRAIVEKCNECEKKREALRAERSRLLEDTRGDAHRNARIIIHETAHPGVELIIAGKAHKIETKTSGRFMIDSETDEITQEFI